MISSPLVTLDSKSTHKVQPTHNSQYKGEDRKQHGHDRDHAEEHPSEEGKAPSLADEHPCPGNDEQRGECEERDHCLAHFTADGVPPLELIVRRSEKSYRVGEHTITSQGIRA